VWQCFLRGKLKLKVEKIFVGDKVLLQPLEENKAIVEEILERKNVLERPPIANADQAIIVSAVSEPAFNALTLDNLLIMTLKEKIRPLLVFNKIDLNPQEGEELYKIYTEIGFDAFKVSCKHKIGIEELKEKLKDKISVIAGVSGVGKSSLLKCLEPAFDFIETGEVSSKTKRGRHTTKYVTLFSLDTGGLVADTPGFSHLQLPFVEPEKLSDFFPEILKFKGDCRFPDCLHWHEPGCAVKEALGKEIYPWRYDHYLHFLKQLKERERRFYA